MIRNNQSHLNTLHVIGDGIIIVLSYILAFWIRFDLMGANLIGGRLSVEQYFSLLYFLVPVYLS